MKERNIDNEQTYILNCLKGIEIKGLEKIDISRLMFNVSGEAIKASKVESIKKLFRTILFNVINVEYDNNGSNLPLVISYNYHRNDHTKYWERFKSIVSEYNEIYVEEGRKNYCRLRSPRDACSVIYDYIHIKKQISIVENGTIRRVIAISIAELLNLKKCLKFNMDYYKSAFIFFDGNKVENLIVQMLQNNGVKVATMQHGQPVFHGLDCDRINQTMILNFSSDYIMVTGEFSKKQFVLGGVPEDKIFVGGSLREIHSVKESGSDFVVFLDCPTNPNAVRDNGELMECAQKISELLGVNYVIKCHPQDDPLNYIDFSDERGAFLPKGCNLQMALKEKRFGILHASGVYLDVLAEGVKAFCYVNDTDFPLVEKGLDSFGDVSELAEKIKKWESYEISQKQEYMNKVIDYYLSPCDVENRYKDFIIKLNERK